MFGMDELSEYEDLKSKLQDLNCPFVCEVDDTGIKEMLFKREESRMKIFGWLVMSFNNKAFPKFQSLNENDNKASVTNYILKIFSDLGYCEEECMAVIQGTAAVKVQAMFFNSILNAIIWNTHSSNSISSISNDTCMDNSNFVPPDVTIVHSNCSESENVKKANFQYTTFIGTVLESEISANFFEEVPLDIQNLLEKQVSVKKSSKSSVIMRTKELNSRVKNLEEGIEGMNKQIEIMDTELKNTSMKACPTENTSIKLRDFCNSLSQSSAFYSIIHSNEIQSRCRIENLHLSELGPICSSLSKVIGQLKNIKEAISQFKIFLEVSQRHRQAIEELSENRGSFENPDGWIHDSRIFRTEFIRFLKPLVSWCNTQYSTMDT